MDKKLDFKCVETKVLLGQIAQNKFIRNRKITLSKQIFSLLVLLICLMNSADAKKKEVSAIDELELKEGEFVKGKKKYNGFAYGVKTEENRFSGVFDNFISVPYDERSPLRKTSKG